MEHAMSETRLLDIQSDYIFKRVFGAEKNKKLLISLINSILQGNPTVTDIELRNSEMSKILKNNRTIHLDIKAEIGTQQFVNIEIQVRNTGEIIERAVQHLATMLTLNSRLLTEEEKRAGKVQTYKDPKVIGIWIMGESITDRTNAVNEASLAFPPTERDDYQIITDKLRIFFVELPKFHPTHIDRRKMLDVWMAFLKNPLNEEIKDVAEVQQALYALQEVSENPEDREIYYLRQQTEFGYLSEKNVAVENAHKSGIQKGIEKGRAEERKKADMELAKERAKAEKELAEERAKAHAEKIEMAKRLLSMGLSIEQIIEATGIHASDDIKN